MNMRKMLQKIDRLDLPPILPLKLALSLHQERILKVYAFMACTIRIVREGRRVDNLP
jgi:hypothetical protein